MDRVRIRYLDFARCQKGLIVDLSHRPERAEFLVREGHAEYFSDDTPDEPRPEAISAMTRKPLLALAETLGITKLSSLSVPQLKAAVLAAISSDDSSEEE